MARARGVRGAILIPPTLLGTHRRSLLIVACLDDVTSLAVVTRALSTPGTSDMSYYRVADAVIAAIGTPVLASAAPAAIAAAMRLARMSWGAPLAAATVDMAPTQSVDTAASKSGVQSTAESRQPLSPRPVRVAGGGVAAALELLRR